MEGFWLETTCAPTLPLFVFPLEKFPRLAFLRSALFHLLLSARVDLIWPHAMHRKRQVQNIKILINEKKTELDRSTLTRIYFDSFDSFLTSRSTLTRTQNCRYSQQYDSLKKVEQEQLALIEKLSNNES